MLVSWYVRARVRLREQIGQTTAEYALATSSPASSTVAGRISVAAWPMNPPSVSTPSPDSTTDDGA